MYARSIPILAKSTCTKHIVEYENVLNILLQEYSWPCNVGLES